MSCAARALKDFKQDEVLDDEVDGMVLSFISRSLWSRSKKPIQTEVSTTIISAPDLE